MTIHGEYEDSTSSKPRRCSNSSLAFCALSGATLWVCSRHGSTSSSKSILCSAHVVFPRSHLFFEKAPLRTPGASLSYCSLSMLSSSLISGNNWYSLISSPLDGKFELSDKTVSPEEQTFLIAPIINDMQLLSTNFHYYIL